MKPSYRTVCLLVVILSVLAMIGAGRCDKDLSPVRTAIEYVESKGSKYAHNKAEDALGILQIRPCMVVEVNRIIGRTVYVNEDRRDVAKSREMFAIYTRHWAAHYKDWSDEGISRRWNGGPTGMSKATTAGYWRKVKDAMKRRK